MSAFQHIAASLLEQSASALAGHAANLFLEEETTGGFGADSFTSWRAHLTVRVRELAVAVEFDTPQLFVAGVDWARSSFEMRGVPGATLERALVCLQRVVEDELPPTVREGTHRCFELALERFSQPLPEVPQLHADDPIDKLALEYLELCLAGHPSRATQHVLAAVENGLDTSEASEMVAHALREVGRLWHSGKLGVHEEHLVTSTTLSLLTQVTNGNRPGKEIGKTVVGAAVGDNAHDLGVRMIMDTFTMSGWRSICLGGHLPTEDIVQSCVDFEADLLVLSATLITHLVTVRDTIAGARQVRPGIRVLVGGLALQGDTGLWRKLGADAHASNSAEAVQEGSRLVGAA